MARLARKKEDGEKRSLWQRAVDLALTDVRVLSSGLADETLEQLEERLIAADFGVQATMRLVAHVEELNRSGRVRERGQLTEALRSELLQILSPGDRTLHLAEAGPSVFLIVGVNGVGKTTSIAKLAQHLVGQGLSVMMAAADTYRAGAVEQLGIWAEQVGASFLRGQQGGDPAAVAFDAVEAARVRGTDVVLVDTAGRLHTNRGLMEELRKVERVIGRRVEGAPHETLIVLDATVGQNGLSQVRAFGEMLGLTGIILAKMDSTARGGVIVALQQEFGLPVKLVGEGEGLEDLRAFEPHDFVEGVFST